MKTEILIGFISPSDSEKETLKKIINNLFNEYYDFRSVELSILETPEKTVNQIWHNTEGKRIDLFVVSDLLNVGEHEQNLILDNLKNRIKHYPFFLFANELFSLDYHILRKDVFVDIKKFFDAKYLIANRVITLVIKYQKYIASCSDKSVLEIHETGYKTKANAEEKQSALNELDEFDAMFKEILTEIKKN
jgi:hypothetical protein